MVIPSSTSIAFPLTVISMGKTKPHPVGAVLDLDELHPLAAFSSLA